MDLFGTAWMTNFYWGIINIFFPNQNKIPGSKTKDFIAHRIASSMDITLVLFPYAHQDQHGGIKVDTPHTVGLHYNWNLPFYNKW